MVQTLSWSFPGNRGSDQGRASFQPNTAWGSSSSGRNARLNLRPPRAGPGTGTEPFRCTVGLPAALPDWQSTVPGQVGTAAS